MTFLHSMMMVMHLKRLEKLIERTELSKSPRRSLVRMRVLQPLEYGSEVWENVSTARRTMRLSGHSCGCEHRADIDCDIGRRPRVCFRSLNPTPKLLAAGPTRSSTLPPPLKFFPKSKSFGRAPSCAAARFVGEPCREGPFQYA
jgi:hypothetical protein